MNRRTVLTTLLAGASAPLLAACSSGITSLKGTASAATAAAAAAA